MKPSTIVVKGVTFGRRIIILKQGWPYRDREDDPEAWYLDVDPVGGVRIVPLTTANVLSWAERFADVHLDGNGQVAA